MAARLNVPGQSRESAAPDFTGPALDTAREGRMLTLEAATALAR